MPQYGKLKIDQFLYNDSGTDVTLNLVDLVTTGANTFTGNQSLGDNNQIRLGSSDDLKIYHDGSNSYLWDTGTGDLHILASDDLKLRSDDIHLMSYSGDETFARFIDDGAVELYYDNSKKFETTSTGVTINGAALVGGNLELNSDAYLKIGASNDLQLYHAGGNSSILNSTGVLTLKNTGSGKLQLMTQDAQDVEIKTNNELSIKSVANGAVELYYDNSKKFETTSFGAQFRGTTNHLNWIQNTNDDKLRFNDGVKAVYGNSDDLQIYHDATNSWLKSNTGVLFINTDSFRINNQANDESLIRGFANGAVELYYDGSKKLETTSTGGLLQYQWKFNDGSGAGGSNKLTFGTHDDLSIYHDGSNSYIKQYGTGSLIIHAADSGEDIYIRAADDVFIQTQTSDYSIKAWGDGAVELYHDNNKKLETTSTGVNITGAITVNGSALSGGSSYAGLLKYF
tara:strand:- start:4298 stop:5662 length:1365 start_codon:yes stop_codon:yes gene_type:complete